MSRPLLFGCLFLTACSTTWDGYPTSLYTVLREGTPPAVLAHHELLGKLLAEAEKNGRKPRGGLTAEYAYYSWIIGKPDTAREALHREGDLYPESRKFLTILERFLPSVPTVTVTEANTADKR